MLKRIKALSVSALSLLLLSGCVLHPVKRTFYEPDSADGHVRGGHCRYLRTHSAVWRKVAGAQWEISFVDVPPGGASRETLDLNLSISAPADAVVFDPHRLRLDVAGTSESLAPTFIDQQPDGPRDREGVVVQRYTISFPHPAGLAIDITIDILPGALAIGGAPQNLAPFHFHRTTKSDLYVESGDC